MDWTQTSVMGEDRSHLSCVGAHKDVPEFKCQYDTKVCPFYWSFKCYCDILIVLNTKPNLKQPVVCYLIKIKYIQDNVVIGNTEKSGLAIIKTKSDYSAVDYWTTIIVEMFHVNHTL